MDYVIIVTAGSLISTLAFWIGLYLGTRIEREKNAKQLIGRE